MIKGEKMKDLALYLMAFLGNLIMFISVLKMFLIDMKNKNNKQKKSKSKHVKFLFLGLVIFILSRVLHGQLL